MANQMQLALPKDIPLLHRQDFPAGFVFGTAGSSYQYEGAVKKRGENIWDTFCKIPGNIVDNSNGDEAVDHHNRYKEDVRIMKEMGVDAYRFSISWSRVLPHGKRSKGENEEGIQFYKDLIQELLDNGIEPYPTLFHWDLPQPLEDEYLGFLSPKVVDDFCDFADLCFSRFGDKVKYWITLNEPWAYCYGGYVTGGLAPGHRTARIEDIKNGFALDRGVNWQQLLALRNIPLGHSGIEPYWVAHYQLLAHAAAVDKYRKCYQARQKGKIGITLVTRWFEPHTDSENDRAAARRAIDFFLGWFMDPVTYGDYPENMKRNVGIRLPKFKPEESRMLKGSYDFLGLNYYTANYAAHSTTPVNPLNPSYITDMRADLKTERNGVPIGPQAGSGWLYVYPKGIWDLLLYIKKVYNNPIIYITENGYNEKDDPSKPLWQARSDPKRIDYHHDHLSYVKDAIKNHDVKVKGYFAWSLLDNFEWNRGYTIRFGIYYIDYKNQLTRYPKLSSLWFKELLLNYK